MDSTNPTTPKRFVVLDFEATCDEGGAPQPQEIIEWPSVLVSAATGEILDEFTSFVRPIRNPRLTRFCEEFTGIRQRDVDGADPFPEVMERHLAWLDGHGLAPRGAGPGEDAASPAAFVTCGDWDLAVMLPAQCRVSDPPAPLLPRPYRRWINVKQPFATAMGRAKAPGMAGMLRELGLPLEGRHHRGIDDCRNIARIVAALLERGSALECTAELPPSAHPPLTVTLHAGEVSGEVTLGTRAIGALWKRAGALVRRPVTELLHEGRSLMSDDDLLDVPSGSVVEAVAAR